MLLPVEEQSNLQPADQDLHICEEEFRVPGRGQALPDRLPSHPPTSSTAPGPTEQPEPEDPEGDLAAVRVINTFAAQHSSALHSGNYYCWQCEVRENNFGVGSDSKEP